MPESGIVCIDFVTLYLSPDNSLQLAQLDASHDPDGILQAIVS